MTEIEILELLHERGGHIGSAKFEELVTRKEVGPLIRRKLVKEEERRVTIESALTGERGFIRFRSYEITDGGRAHLHGLYRKVLRATDDNRTDIPDP
jgi:hypothetical protein